MYLTEQHIITVNDKRYKDLDRICFLSKNLYNAALYIIKQEFLVSGKWIRSVELNKKMVAENNVDFRALSGSSSQQILMALDRNLKSYFSAIKHGKGITRNLPDVLNSRNTSIKQKEEIYFLILMHNLSIEENIFTFQRKKVCNH